MNEVNQLILDCLARVLRINQTTDADITFELTGEPASLICYGYKNGYAQTVAEDGESPRPDFSPISKQNFMGSIFYDKSRAEETLRDLLASLDSLERELMQSA